MMKSMSRTLEVAGADSYLVIYVIVIDSVYSFVEPTLYSEPLLHVAAVLVSIK